MLSKYLAIAVAVLVALLLASGLLLKSSYSANGALKTRAEGAEKAIQQAQEQRKLDGALLARRAAEVGSERRKSATLAEALRRAQDGAPDWSATPTPTAVQEALSGAVRGLHDGSVIQD